MATNTYYFAGKAYPASFNFNPSLGQLLFMRGSQVMSESADELTLRLSNGLDLKLSGTFQLDPQGHVIDGTISSLELFRSGNILVQELFGLSINFQDFRSAAQTNGSGAFALWLLAGDDTFNGSPGNDDMVGGAGNDTMTGNGGNDSFSGGPGLDSYSGGDGRDTLSYESTYNDPSATQGVSIHATTQIAIDPYGNTETFNTMEAFRGTQFADVMTGANSGTKVANESFMGLGGADNINGGAGIDEVRYDRDSVRGGNNMVIVNLTTGEAIDGFGDTDTLANIENVRGSKFGDTITGNEASNDLRGFGGNDVFIGGGGADHLDGGDGMDRASYLTAAGRVVVRLASPSSNTGDARGDDYVSIESLSGSRYGDFLYGTSGVNSISGGAGNDTIAGYNGNDFLSGGTGKDRFDFRSALSPTNNVDKISDFSVVDDTVRLENSVFKALGAAGALSSSMFWKSTSGRAHDSNDRIIYDTDSGKLYYDSNGNAAGGSVHFATLATNLSLTHVDFLII